MVYQRIVNYTIGIVSGKKVTYHHIEFLKAGKVSVEVHYRPSWMSHPVHNKRLQAWFLAHADACFSNEKKDWGFCVPTFEFNVIFLLSHIYTHLIRAIPTIPVPARKSCGVLASAMWRVH